MSEPSPPSDAIGRFLAELLGGDVAHGIARTLADPAADGKAGAHAIDAALASPRLQDLFKRRHTLGIGKSGRLQADFAFVGLEAAQGQLAFAELFATVCAPRLEKRADGFRKLFDRLARDREGPPLIVETGCLRLPGNWGGDGQSTFLFDAFARAHGGTCLSVDINFESVASARRACSSFTTVVLNDSVSFLHALAGILPDRRIDLLYLDSFDVDPRAPLPAAIHHVKELLAAWPMLGPGSIVCVDDFAIGDAGGKGGIIDDFFKNVAAKELFSGYQKAWVIGP